MRAIDLYAGIGGWSLGFRLAGVEVVASYEWWQPAIDTHNGNHGGTLTPVDIRQLELADLPENIQLVVGSPPCTEFSYSNRGGRGNVAEGMKDLVRFFEVVEHCKPQFWAMENVPRVAEVLREGFADKAHPLYRFRKLGAQVEVFDFSNFGTPQGRRRCIATNIPLHLIKELQQAISPRTLGDVVTALSERATIVDPIWGTSLSANQLTEMETEPALNDEELRMNREAKTYHPVYNNMAFPDPLDTPARTVTATCTRVSRESIVIEDPRIAGRYRRLTIRERASLQGFPITYQFFARSFAEKAKMVGNAIPPTFTHLLALAAQGALASGFDGYAAVGTQLALPKHLPRPTPPDQEGRTYPPSRSFRAALPHLRFKSGMRFDLSNDLGTGTAKWRVRFFFGPSKDVRELELDGSITGYLGESDLFGDLIRRNAAAFRRAEQDLLRTSPAALQLAWTHKADGTGPFAVTDQLGMLADIVHASIEEIIEPEDRAPLEAFIIAVAASADDERRLVSESKLRRYASRVLAGIIVGEWFNTLAWHSDCRKAA
ncbi:MAG TPA: DNA (cytosine-5-)-methyltransferase [Sphingobium sp.]|nr:DNA (cytosine-5-)-methyltransferase [Sphingobium sp.]